jgi:hypothetical protein
MQATSSIGFSSDRASTQLFAAHFDQQPFLFKHALHEHELFSMPALKNLALRMAASPSPQGFFVRAGSWSGPRWGTAEFRRDLERDFDNIDTSQMRLKLTRIHNEPGYREVLQSCMRELSELTGADKFRNYFDPFATLFVSSPGEITPYHVDAETNCLLQLRGEKAMYVFDGNDRELLGWQELENYFGGGAQVHLRPDQEGRGREFELRPGWAIHNPPLFPHWVQNGPFASVSLSISLNHVRSAGDVLHANYYLRKIGVDPEPPRGTRPADAVKIALARTVRTSKRFLKKRLAEIRYRTVC